MEPLRVQAHIGIAESLQTCSTSTADTISSLASTATVATPNFREEAHVLRKQRNTLERQEANLSMRMLIAKIGKETTSTESRFDPLGCRDAYYYVELACSLNQLDAVKNEIESLLKSEVFDGRYADARIRMGDWNDHLAKYRCEANAENITAEYIDDGKSLENQFKNAVAAQMDLDTSIGKDRMRSVESCITKLTQIATQIKAEVVGIVEEIKAISDRNLRHT